MYETSKRVEKQIKFIKKRFFFLVITQRNLEELRFLLLSFSHNVQVCDANLTQCGKSDNFSHSSYFTLYSLLNPGDLLVVDGLLLRQVVNLPEHWRQGKSVMKLHTLIPEFRIYVSVKEQALLIAKPCHSFVFVKVSVSQWGIKNHQLYTCKTYANRKTQF